MSDIQFDANKALASAEAAISCGDLDKVEADTIGGAGYLTARLVSACMCAIPEGLDGMQAHRQLIFDIQSAHRKVKNRIVDIRRKRNWARGTPLAVALPS